jgi:Holliday junction resolvase
MVADIATLSGGVKRRGGRRSRDKGSRGERIVVRLLQEYGFAAERVPLSGAMRGRFGADVSVPLLGVDRRAEVKCRADGFREFYKWLEGVDFLIVRADRAEPLIVLRLKFAAEIAALAERAKSSTNSVPETVSAPAASGKTEEK